MFEATDFKALGSRLKHKDKARASFIQKLRSLRKPKTEAIFTESERAHLSEVSDAWIKKKATTFGAASRSRRKKFMGKMLGAPWRKNPKRRTAAISAQSAAMATDH